MKVLIVDDEPLALRHMSAILSAEADVKVIGACSDPIEAISMTMREKPHLIFMDIEMPEMNGLEAAEKLMEIAPDVRVVFVTAYNNYAIAAFEMNALDYLLKPIKSDRVRWALDRVRETVALDKNGHRPDAAFTMLRLFGAIEIKRGDREPQRISWRTQKAQELFACLLHHHGQIIRKDALIDMLWPGLASEKAFTNLYTAAYQLRKTLEQLESGIRILSGEEGYWLDKGDVRTDAEEWEALLRNHPDVNADTIDEHLRLMELNRGDYLQGLDYEWASNKRGLLDALWLHHVSKVVRWLLGAGRYAEATVWSQELQRRHPYDGQSYYFLMQIYAATGEPAAVDEQYARLDKMLATQFNNVPDARITEWYRSYISVS